MEIGVVSLFSHWDLGKYQLEELNNINSSVEKHIESSHIQALLRIYTRYLERKMM